MALRFLELLFFLFFVLILLTQIFVPIKNGTPIFPFLRRKKLIKKLEEVNDKKEEFEIEKTIEKSQKELDDEKARFEEEKAAGKKKKK
jgi:hypothetical protein